nr:SpoIIIAC/SpoIIIAD family protein [uncultured Agathobaculum sp.]
MSGLVAICGVVLLALVLSIVLKKDAPVIALLLTLTAGAMVLLRVFDVVGSAAQQLSALLAQSGMTDSLYLPVMQAVGIAVVVRIMGALCKDAGQSALAAKLEIAGAVLAISVCMPLFEQVIRLMAEWTA